MHCILRRFMTSMWVFSARVVDSHRGHRDAPGQCEPTDSHGNPQIWRVDSYATASVREYTRRQTRACIEPCENRMPLVNAQRMDAPEAPKTGPSEYRFSVKAKSRMQTVAVALALLFLAWVNAPAYADKHYGPGVTDTEIKLGQTMPYSGPASAYATIGRAEQAYFDKINGEGGVNGRKIKLISLDDGFNPAKTVEQTRRLVESDEVLALFNSLGPGPLAIQKYVNQRKVPLLFVGSGAKEWDDPEHFPWSMGLQPGFEGEGRAFGKYIARNYPKAKVAVLAVNADLGRDGVNGLREVLAKYPSVEIVAVVSHEITDPNIDSQIVTLQASGADVLIDWAIPKTSAQVIRKLHDIGWKPMHLLSTVSNSVAAVLVPAGVDKAVGIVTTEFLKDPSDPAWKDDAAMKEYFSWMRRFYPDGNPEDGNNAYAYLAAQTMVHVLKKCGDDLTRENLMRQAASINHMDAPMLMPGISLNTSTTNYRPIRQLQMLRFDGKEWVRAGDVLEP
jgi:branched-chain amino acid transport system substrate-binding protein